MSNARAYAHTNIALIKYWGKRGQDDAHRALNLPATGSLSLTLDRFGTETEVRLVDDGEDRASLDGVALSGKELGRIQTFLDLVRARAGRTERCVVESRNDVPTAAGLASSASGFAALAVAATTAFELKATDAELSALARQGSGSAARSIFAGFARMERGVLDDGSDAIAAPMSVADGFDVRLLVVRCAQGRKKTGSTVGMQRTTETSPFYDAWVQTHAADLDDATEALAAGDLNRVGETMEHSTLKMHASALAARPGLWYFAAPTVSVMSKVRDLREDDGVPCFFTMDAGPHVKVLCRPQDAPMLVKTLGTIDGVFGVEVAGPGPAPRVMSPGE